MNELFIFIGIIVRVIGLTIIVVEVMPKMFIEAKVENGLGFLRKSLFIMISLFVLLNIAFTVWNSARLLNYADDSLINIIGIANSVNTLIIAIFIYLIYHKKYPGQET